MRVWGPYACFTRPELKMERVSYPLITPSAARGVLEAVYWKPEFSWIIHRIYVLRSGRTTLIKRNEISNKISGRSDQIVVDDPKVRVQRTSFILKDVDYVIEANIAGPDYRSLPTEEHGKHCKIFRNRAEKGRCFQRPFLGCKEFAANFELVKDFTPEDYSADVGLMFYDWDYSDQEYEVLKLNVKDFAGCASRDEAEKLGAPKKALDEFDETGLDYQCLQGWLFARKNGPTPMFFKAVVNDGVLNVPHPTSNEVLK